MRSARLAGVILGLLSLATFMLASRPGPVEPELGAKLDLALVAPGEVEVDPVDPQPLLSAANLVPGGPPGTGSARLRNRSASPVALAFGIDRAESESFGRLAGALTFAVTVDGMEVLRGGLGQIVGTPFLSLPADRTVTLEAAAWLPAGVPVDHVGERAAARIRLVAAGGGAGGRSG